MYFRLSNEFRFFLYSRHGINEPISTKKQFTLMYMTRHRTQLCCVLAIVLLVCLCCLMPVYADPGQEDSGGEVVSAGLDDDSDGNDEEHSETGDTEPVGLDGDFWDLSEGDAAGPDVGTEVTDESAGTDDDETAESFSETGEVYGDEGNASGDASAPNQTGYGNLSSGGSVVPILDAGYEDMCNAGECVDDLDCKPDLWSANPICCNANECAGNGKCFAEYACVNGPVKLCNEGIWMDVLDYEINCFDGIDNDCDGNIDEEDDDCYNSNMCGNGICEEDETLSSCPEDCAIGKTIIIRNDDIGPWWSVDNVIYITDFIKEKGVSQTLGIIPLTDGGTISLNDDTKLVSYLRSISRDSKIEIGISGLTHEYNEFAGISQSEAEEKIADAKQMIADSVYVEPVTFMPPYYEYDESTLHAAKNQGMASFSAGWNAIDMGHGFSEYPPGLWNVPATTDFYDWNTNTFYSASEIEESCEDALDAFGTCVIILYHHTFVDGNDNIDQEKIALLGEVLDWVKDKEDLGVELKTMNKHNAIDPPESGEKYIVFRSDDFAAFWSVSSAISITETLRDKGVAQVLSVVPTNVGYTLDDDPVLADYLNIIKDDASIEIALHGYDHSEYEFRDMPYLDARFKIGTGLDILQNVLGIIPTTFVPPYHEYNDNTLRALEMHNISTISSGYDDFVRGREFEIDEYGILHLPVAAEFYNWWENRVNAAEEIIVPCENAMENHNVCVIMLHHHMFKDANGNMDPAKVKVLTDVADWAKSKEADGSAKIVLLKDIGIDDL